MTPDSLAALARDLERFDFLGGVSLGGDQYATWQTRKLDLWARAKALGADGLVLYQTCVDAATERLADG